MTELHVSPAGSDLAPGTPEAPLRTISKAARLALPGDTVVVHEGEYREWVKPARGGRSDLVRITYTAAPGERVVIKGSEPVTGWVREADGVWRAEVENSLFGDWNPFAIPLDGDWLESPRDPAGTLGDVYLDGRSLFWAPSRDDVAAPLRRTQDRDVWTARTVPVADPDWTQRVWWAEVGESVTTIWANFGDVDPNAALTEINVRKSVFSPEGHHRDWITVRGFEMAQAATPWAPPTADQPGLIGPNWAKGWIIEDNVIHDSKCSGISLGKESSTGDGFAHERRDKPGHHYQVEAVFTALRHGWDKETIGSHVVRRNRIYDCGQTGIVGHLGCAFSRIEDNHIFRIGLKREYFGHEIAGIKLHAPIDTELVHNRINDCSLGIWLDWQAQGTRISRNLMYANNRDLFIEVTHGPYVVDHNVLASPAAVEIFSQGGAYVNNLLAGTTRLWPVHDRTTPYHVPHSTQVAGFDIIAGGDDRWSGNLFVAGNPDEAYLAGSNPHAQACYGTCFYENHPASFEEFQASKDPNKGDNEAWFGLPQPVYAAANAYTGGAAPFRAESDAVVAPAGETASVRVTEEGDEVYLSLEVPAAALAARTPVVTGADLPPTLLVGAAFEAPDGTPVVLDEDLHGTRKVPGTRYPAGPLADLTPGTPVRVW